MLMAERQSARMSKITA